MKIIEISDKTMEILEKIVKGENKFYQGIGGDHTPASFVEDLILKYWEDVQGGGGYE